jgi:hypothetical protein
MNSSDIEYISHVRYIISFGSVQKPIRVGHVCNTCSNIIQIISFIRFEVITAVICKILVFWRAILCNFTDGYRRLGKHSDFILKDEILS